MSVVVPLSMCRHKTLDGESWFCKSCKYVILVGKETFAAEKISV